MSDSEFGDEELETAPAGPRAAGRAGKGRGQRRGFAGQGQAALAGGSSESHSGDKTGVLPAAFVFAQNKVEKLQLLLALRQHRLRRFLARLGLFVILPSAITLFYTALIETPRYVCHFEITYQAYQPNTSLAGGLTPSVFGSSANDSVDYGTLIYEYIRSGALAAQVDKTLSLRQHLASDKIDWFSRLGHNANDAAFLKAWRNHVAVSEGFGGYLTVNVQGFDPAYTLRLAQTINADADAMIDGLNARARADEIRSATLHLNSAAAALKDADDALTLFRNTHGDVDPNFAATQIATIIGSLESQLDLVRAQLVQAQANLQPGASQIVQLQLQVKALQTQIAAERQRLSTSSSQTSSYSSTVEAYNDLLSNQQFANTTYQAAQQGLIVALADAAAKENFVVDFVPPVLPDRPTMPDPLLSTFTVFLACLSIYGIANLMFTAFRDQSGL